MHRIDGYGHDDNMFTEGNPATGVPATWVTADWANALQEEVVKVIEEAGIELDKEDNTQLLAGIMSLFKHSQFGVDAESSDAYVVTLDPAPSDYFTGMIVVFTANTANTGAATLNVNSLGATAIKKQNNDDLETGDIESGQVVIVVYDGTYFQMISHPATITSLKDNVTQADGKYIATDKIRARDGDGLCLHDDGGLGIFIQDGGYTEILSFLAGSYAAKIFNSSASGHGVHLKGGGTGTNHRVLIENSEDTTNPIVMLGNGKFGVWTLTPSQIFELNQGSGNMIADGYDTHSLSTYKESISEVATDLEKFAKLKVFTWKRPPFVSAEELADAAKAVFDIENEISKEEALEEIEIEVDLITNQDGQTVKNVVDEVSAGYKLQEDGSVQEIKKQVFEKTTKTIFKLEEWARFDEATGKFYDTRTQWKTAFPDGYRGGKLRKCPDAEILEFLDNLGDQLRTERCSLPEWQREYYGLVADDESLLENYPDVATYDDDGNPAGVNLNNQVGMLHGILKTAVTEILSLKEEVSNLKEELNKE